MNKKESSKVYNSNKTQHRSGSNAKPQKVCDVSHLTSLRKCYLRNILCLTMNLMWSWTCLSLILSVLLMISIGVIGSTGAQPTFKDPNLESKLVVKDLSSSNNTTFVDNNKNN